MRCTAPVEVDGDDGRGQLVDWTAFQAARSELGAGFVRILGYFREDGIKSVAAIEDAMRNGNAAALVLPAHTLKGESRQFGAEPLSMLAESIEISRANASRPATRPTRRWSMSSNCARRSKRR